MRGAHGSRALAGNGKPPGRPSTPVQQSAPSICALRGSAKKRAAGRVNADSQRRGKQCRQPHGCGQPEWIPYSLQSYCAGAAAQTGESSQGKAPLTAACSRMNPVCASLIDCLSTALNLAGNLPIKHCKVSAGPSVIGGRPGMSHQGKPPEIAIFRAKQRTTALRTGILWTRAIITQLLFDCPRAGIFSPPGTQVQARRPNGPGWQRPRNRPREISSRHTCANSSHSSSLSIFLTSIRIRIPVG